jgi:DNA polymerase-3 subunit beta
MRISMEVKPLKAALTVCRRHTSRSIPILESVLIQVKDGQQPTVSTTDLETAVTVAVPGAVVGEGPSEVLSFCVPLKPLAEVVRGIQATTIILEVEEHQAAVEIRFEGGSASLECKASEEYPGLPTITPDAQESTIDADTLQALSRVLHAASTDETRYNLNGVCAETIDGHIIWTATDGHRLATTSTPGEWPSASGEVILPRVFVDEVARQAKRSGAIVSADPSLVKAAFDTVTVISRLIEGKYPNYRQVIPKDHTLKAWVDRNAAMDVLKRASKLSMKNHAVKITLHGEFIVEAGSENGSAREALAVDYDGPEIVMGVNAKYLIDALGAFDADRVALRFSGAVKKGQQCSGADPVRVDAIDPDTVAVVMPMRL